jgi:16S rRNA processing protein RimM
MDNLVFLGKITSTHGIKGELKIKSDLEVKNRVFVKNFRIYIDEIEHVITSYRSHKQFDMITIDNIYDINEIYQYVGRDVFIKRADLKLNSDEYLLNDLLDFEVIWNDKVIGKVKSVLSNGANNLIKVQDFYIPLIDNYIKKVDLVNKKIYTNDVKELML